MERRKCDATGREIAQMIFERIAAFRFVCLFIEPN